jgi:hypothetical protein
MFFIGWLVDEVHDRCGVTQIAHRLGVSPATPYRYIPAARSANTQAFGNGRFI